MNSTVLSSVTDLHKLRLRVSSASNYSQFALPELVGLGVVFVQARDVQQCRVESCHGLGAAASRNDTVQNLQETSTGA